MLGVHRPVRVLFTGMAYVPLRCALLLLLSACVTARPVPNVGPSSRERGEVPLRLFERICSDSSNVGQAMTAQVVNTRVPGGLFAKLELRRVEAAEHTFHFEVLGLFDLDRSVAVRAPARSTPHDIEPGPRDPRFCIHERATVLAVLADEVSRFQYGSVELQSSPARRMSTLPPHDKE